MFTTRLLNEVKTSLNSIKETLEEQEIQLDMDDKVIDILLNVPIESRDEQYYNVMYNLLDQHGYYLNMHKDNLILYTKLVRVLKTLESDSD